MLTVASRPSNPSADALAHNNEAEALEALDRSMLKLRDLILKLSSDMPQLKRKPQAINPKLDTTLPPNPIPESYHTSTININPCNPKTRHPCAQKSPQPFALHPCKGWAFATHGGENVLRQRDYMPQPEDSAWQEGNKSSITMHHSQEVSSSISSTTTPTPRGR